MFCKKHTVFHVVDRCIRFGAGQEVPDKTMTLLMDAYLQVWMHHGPAEVLYSDGEGALSNPTPKGSPKSERHRSSHTSAMPTCHGRRIKKRHSSMHHARRGIITQETRYTYCVYRIASRSFVCNAFTFYDGCSPCQALYDRQPACLPDLQAIDHEEAAATS